LEGRREREGKVDTILIGTGIGSGGGTCGDRRCGAEEGMEVVVVVAVVVAVVLVIMVVPWKTGGLKINVSSALAMEERWRTSDVSNGRSNKLS
jgi:hypothetical protein